MKTVCLLSASCWFLAGHILRRGEMFLRNVHWLSQMELFEFFLIHFLPITDICSASRMWLSSHSLPSSLPTDCLLRIVFLFCCIVLLLRGRRRGGRNGLPPRVTLGDRIQPTAFFPSCLGAVYFKATFSSSVMNCSVLLFGIAEQGPQRSSLFLWPPRSIDAVPNCLCNARRTWAY
jgi:hypothetical protein